MAGTIGGISMNTEAAIHLENWERQLRDLTEAAERRFWILIPEDSTRERFLLLDERGRLIFGPSHFMGLRGFFANQPAQA